MGTESRHALTTAEEDVAHVGVKVAQLLASTFVLDSTLCTKEVQSHTEHDAYCSASGRYAEVQGAAMVGTKGDSPCF